MMCSGHRTKIGPRKYASRPDNENFPLYGRCLFVVFLHQLTLLREGQLRLEEDVAEKNKVSCLVYDMTIVLRFVWYRKLPSD